MLPRPTAAAATGKDDMPPVNTIGEPCWERASIKRAISTVARLDPQLADYFLATHAPFDHIWDERGNVKITETALFERLTNEGRANVWAVVYGEPGTGKSHLIRWLHLRCEIAKRDGTLQDIFPILMQRRTGSLRDALTQIVEQLPKEFETHLRYINSAIVELSDSTAREKLANALQLELGPRWTESGNAPLPTALANAEELCRSPGTRKWLCRRGGVIDRTINHLTEQTDVVDRITLPEFQQSDFDFPVWN